MAGATTTTTSPARTGARRFTTRLALVSAACVAVPLSFAYVTGSIGIPHNDDWAFLRILFRFADTGSIELVGWNEMTLVGQLFVAFPFVKVFGDNVALVNTLSAVVSGAGLFMLGSIARRFVAPSFALAIVALVGTFPAFAGVVATFMTDNTAFAAQMGCVLMGLVAFERQGRGRDVLVGAALALGLFALSVREFAILAPLAVVGGYAVANRRDGRSIVNAIVALAGLLLAGFVLYRWRRSFAGDTSHFFASNFSLQMVPYLTQAFFTFSLGVAPAAIVALRSKGRAAIAWGPAVVVAVAFAVFAVQQTGGNPTCCYNSPGSVFLGNLLTERGALGNQALFADRPVLFPPVPWMLLTAGAIAAGAALLALAARRLTTPEAWRVGRDPGATTLALLGWSTATAIVFRHALGGPLFDRYVVVPVAIAAILLLRDVSAPRSLAEVKGAVAVGAALALVGTVVVGSGASFDAARWRGGEAAIDAGIAAGDIDAGFEWVGFHYDGVVNEAVPRRSAYTPPGYMNMFPAAGNCGLVAASEQTGEDFELLATVPYRQWLGVSVEHLWVYRYRPGCEAAGI
jgi:Dolichyl-phosphate-mannose-protein mannosyltransferase